MVSSKNINIQQQSKLATIKDQLAARFESINMGKKYPQSKYVTGFGKTDPNHTFGISRITNLKYLTHCESLLLGCSHAMFAV